MYPSRWGRSLGYLDKKVEQYVNEIPEPTSKLKKLMPEPEYTPAYWRVSQMASLSFRALGVHTYLMSLPEGWDISADRIARARVEGRDAVRKALQELEAASLVKRTKYRQKDGTLRTTIEVFAVPYTEKTAQASTSNDDIKPQVVTSAENQASVNQSSVNQASKKKDSRREILEKEEEISPTSISLLTPQAASNEKPGTEIALFEDKPAKLEKPKTQRRGSRIPEHFVVTPEMVAWAREETPSVDGRYETAKFVDYWRSKSGAGATKLDWVATWRNWMRTAQDRSKGTQSHANGPDGPGGTQAWLQRSMDRAREMDAAAARGEKVGVFS